MHFPGAAVLKPYRTSAWHLRLIWLSRWRPVAGLLRSAGEDLGFQRTIVLSVPATLSFFSTDKCLVTRNIRVLKESINQTCWLGQYGIGKSAVTLWWRARGATRARISLMDSYFGLIGRQPFPTFLRNRLWQLPTIQACFVSKISLT